MGAQQGGNGQDAKAGQTGPSGSEAPGSARASSRFGSANPTSPLVVSAPTPAQPGSTPAPQPPQGALIPTHHSKGYVIELGYDPTVEGANPRAPYGYKVDGKTPRKRPPFGQPFALGPDARRQPAGQPKADDTSKMREKARKQGDAAMKTLVQVMTRGANDRVRLDAACALLDRGYGKPTQMIAGEGDSPIRIEVREGLVTKLRALASAAGVPMPPLPGVGKN